MPTNSVGKKKRRGCSRIFSNYPAADVETGAIPQSTIRIPQLKYGYLLSDRSGMRTACPGC